MMKGTDMDANLNYQNRQDARESVPQPASGAGGVVGVRTQIAQRDELERLPEHPASTGDRKIAAEQPEEAQRDRSRKRIDPIAAAEAKLKQKEAKLAESRNLLQQRKRKVRNGQLYVWGAMVESAYRYGDDEQRKLLRGLAETYLTDERHRERSGFGFTRVDSEREESKV